MAGFPKLSIWLTSNIFMPSAKGFCIAYIKYSRAFNAFWQGLPIWFGQATKSSVAIVVVQVLIKVWNRCVILLPPPYSFFKSFYVPEPRCNCNGWLYHQSSAPFLGSFLTYSIAKTRFFHLDGISVVSAWICYWMVFFI